MTILFYSFIFLLGLTVGSFLNCVIYRLHSKNIGIGISDKRRSYCPHCKHTLGWKDLIPVLSFIILRGKCRYCKKNISWQYPIVEIATGALFLLIFSFQSVFNQFSVFNFIIACFLIIIFVYDLKHYIIPDKVIYPAIVITLAYRIVSGLDLPTVLAAFGAAGFFATIVLVSRGKWMGIGDIKLAFLMGLLLGWPNILTAMFISFILGAVIGLSLLIARKKTLKSEVPFGPFLVTGTFLAMFWGSWLVDWYLSLFLLQ